MLVLLEMVPTELSSQANVITDKKISMRYKYSQQERLLSALLKTIIYRVKSVAEKFAVRSVFALCRQALIITLLGSIVVINQEK